MPAASSHLPKNSSPKNGLSGFFSLPNFSLRLAYCCFNVLKNHFITSMHRFAGSFSAAGATKTEGCSVQYDENSVRDLVERIKAGAVMVERSPLKEAIDYSAISASSRIRCDLCTLRKLDQEPFAWGGTAEASAMFAI